jgi:hypothetical protein
MRTGQRGSPCSDAFETGEWRLEIFRFVLLFDLVPPVAALYERRGIPNDPRQKEGKNEPFNDGQRNRKDRLYAACRG